MTTENKAPLWARKTDWNAEYKAQIAVLNDELLREKLLHAKLWADEAMRMLRGVEDPFPLLRDELDVFEDNRPRLLTLNDRRRMGQDIVILADGSPIELGD